MKAWIEAEGVNEANLIHVVPPAKQPTVEGLPSTCKHVKTVIFLT